MPWAPVSGHVSLTNFITAFISTSNVTQWDVLNIMSQDNKVMAERLDRTKVGDIEIGCLALEFSK